MITLEDAAELMKNQPSNQATEIDELSESCRIIKGVADPDDDLMLYVLDEDGWDD